MAAALVSNGPAIDPEWGICPSEMAVQYQPDGRLSTFPKNTATFTGKLLIVAHSAPHAHATLCWRDLSTNSRQPGGGMPYARPGLLRPPRHRAEPVGAAMGPHSLGQFGPSLAPFGGAEIWRTISCELNGSVSAHGRASTLKTLSMSIAKAIGPTTPAAVRRDHRRGVGHAQAAEPPCNGDLGGSGCDDARLGASSGAVGWASRYAKRRIGTGFLRRMGPSLRSIRFRTAAIGSPPGDGQAAA
jgi:hypothetical protein